MPYFAIPVLAHLEREALENIELLVLRPHHFLPLQSLADHLNPFGTGALALRHCPGEVPTISRKLLLKAGWSVNPVSSAISSNDLSEYNSSDLAARILLCSK
jgi:hypothetical protein